MLRLTDEEMKITTGLEYNTLYWAARAIADAATAKAAQWFLDELADVVPMAVLKASGGDYGTVYATLRGILIEKAKAEGLKVKGVVE